MSKPNQAAAVLGGGAFGTAIAVVLGRQGIDTRLWVRRQDLADEINEKRENEAYLKGVRLPDSVKCMTSVDEVVAGVDAVFFVIPSQFVRAFVVEHRAVWPLVPLVVCAKGIENGSLQNPYEILRDELPGKYSDMLAVLSGPSFAGEMAQGQVTNVAVASFNKQVATTVQEILTDKTFRVYTSSDVLGCEVAGATKNVLAIAAGAVDGMGLGQNTKAAMVCRGLAEMSRLAKKLGSTGEVMAGLAGIGDLMLTCNSTLSRNFTVGRRLATGESLEAVTSGRSVAEGVASAKSLRELAEKADVEMPICNMVYQVLYCGKTVPVALSELISRPVADEFRDA